MVVFANAGAGLWALAAHRVESLRTRALWWFTAFAETAVVAQVVLGVLVVRGRDTKPYQFHMFYGFVAMIAVAILYSYRHQLRERIYLLYGLGGLFIMGLAIRAMIVGR